MSEDLFEGMDMGHGEEEKSLHSSSSDEHVESSGLQRNVPQRTRRKRGAGNLDIRVKNRAKRRKELSGIDKLVHPASDEESRLECFSESSVQSDGEEHENENLLNPLALVQVLQQGSDDDMVPPIEFGSVHSEEQSQNLSGAQGDVETVDVDMDPAPTSSPMSFETVSTPFNSQTRRNVGIACASKDVSAHQLHRAAIESEPIYTVLTYMRTYLSLTLTRNWSVALEDDTLSICSITIVGSVPVIERSIVWKENRAHIFVRGKPLPQNHLLWNIPLPDIENYGSVCDYITRLSYAVPIFSTCQGISGHDHLWEESKSKGFTEISFSVKPCFRSANCGLLVPYGDTTCKSCRFQASDFVRIHNRKVRNLMGEKDQSKVNIKYKERTDLEQDLKDKHKESRYLKKKYERLAERFEKHIQKNTVDIDSGMTQDLKKICQDNYGRMSPTEKIFWEQQQIALNKKFKGTLRSMRWHPVMIRIALRLRQTSPAACDILHEEGFLTLPSQRRLRDYSQFVDAREGCQKELLLKFRAKMLEMCPSEEDRYFVLMHDEMHIRSNLVFSKRTGTMVGYVNLPEYLQELNSLQSEPDIQTEKTKKSKKLAKKVLVYLVQGVTTELQFIPAIYSTADLTASELFNRSWEVIFFMERFGAKIICVVCDGASTNRKFIKMNPNYSEKDFVYVTKNLASGSRSRPIFFMLDPPHLWKTFRNSLANSFSHRRSRSLWKNGEDLSWRVLELLHELCKSKFSDLKLTKAHVKLTNFSCMKVKFAVQVFSNSVVEKIKASADSDLAGTQTKELCKFLSLMNRFIDVLNGGDRSEKRKENPDLNPYTSEDDPRFDLLLHDFLGYFEDWKKDVDARLGNFSKEERSRMQISQQTLDAAKVTVYSFVYMSKWLLSNNVKSVSARVFNQDPLEQTFSLFRMKGGANNAPDLLQVMQYRVAMDAAGTAVVSGSKRGNTEVNRKIAFDDAPVPVRKKVKTNLMAALCLENYFEDYE